MTLKTPSKVEVTDNFSDPGFAFADKDQLEFTDCLCSMSVFSCLGHMKSLTYYDDVRVKCETCS